jgi:hypothetical protein
VKVESGPGAVAAGAGIDEDEHLAINATVEVTGHQCRCKEGIVAIRIDLLGLFYSKM